MRHEHVHKWRWHSNYGEDGIDCELCAEEYGYRPENWMGRDEIIRRLNAVEKLEAERGALAEVLAKKDVAILVDPLLTDKERDIVFDAITASEVRDG